MEQLCELCDNAGPLTVRGRCHPTAPLRIEIDNGFLNAFCYVPSCNRLVATLELAAGTESESAVFNAKLTAANAEIERLKAERDGFFEHGIAVAKERDQLRAERDALNARTLKWCDELQDEICRLTIQLSAANAEIERLKSSSQLKETANGKA